MRLSKWCRDIRPVQLSNNILMPVILFDHSRDQFKRWLLRNSPIVPLTLIIGLTLAYCPNVTTHFILLIFGIFCVVVVLLGALFRRIILFEADGQMACEYRFLGLFTIDRKVVSVSECTFVRYHTWQLPYGQNRVVYHAAIYLHFHNQRPWRICDQCHYSMDVECDELMAEQLAARLKVPVEQVDTAPVV